MARKTPVHEAQLSFEYSLPSQHDYSQEDAGEFPFVRVSDTQAPRVPVNEVVDAVDMITPADLVDATWDRHNELFGHNPARREAIDKARKIYEDSVADRQAAAQETLSPERKNVLLALDMYMGYIVYSNQARGMRKQFYAHPSAFTDRYETEDKVVLHDAQLKRDYMHIGYQDALQVLFEARKSAPELKAFSSIDDVASFTAALEKAYGAPGREMATQRNKIRDKATQLLGGRAVVEGLVLDVSPRSQ